MFVILDAIEDNICLVADGSNCCQAIETLSDLTLLIGKEPKTLDFKNQSGIDHCASSAVVIAIEMIRIYKRKDYKYDSLFMGVNSDTRCKKCYNINSTK